MATFATLVVRLAGVAAMRTLGLVPPWFVFVNAGLLVLDACLLGLGAREFVALEHMPETHSFVAAAQVLADPAPEEVRPSC